jgi:hypothetical protein
MAPFKSFNDMTSSASTPRSNLERLDRHKFEAMSRHPQFLSAVAQVMSAMAVEKQVNQTVNGYKMEVFQRFQFRIGDTMGSRSGGSGEPITTPDLVYLSDDVILNHEYYEALDQAHRLAGFQLPHHHCPASCAEHRRIRAEHALLAVTDKLLGTDFRGACLVIDRRKQLLELLLKMAARLCEAQLRALAQEFLPKNKEELNDYLTL